MNNDNNTFGDPAMTHRGVDMAVAILLIAVGGLTMYDSYQVGIGWESGPQSGYFPFYVGLLLSLASAVTLVQASLGGSVETFVDWPSLKRVLTVLLPAAVFVAAIPYLGIYVAGALFIATFMTFIGKYQFWKGLGIGAAVSVAFFLIFQKWFLIQLPIGPLERALGY
ncbi:MAG TPA: tripartite tricarboxylate transporter TctB family protein [Aestuariivirgaceae bacterium]|nr:tripartite tricarboxylate transporter TctB family protein [Aestuariivirgaceae bacterium]